MSAEILEFEKPDEWYIRRSAEWSRRGELSKSLLYAYMTKKDDRAARMCKAAILYESGNLTPALRMLVSLRDAGDRGGDMYALIIKVLHDMTRYISASYFMGEALAAGAFPFASGTGAPTTRSAYMRLLGAVRSEYPDNKYDSDAPGVLYVLCRSRYGTDEGLAAEMLFDEHDFAGSETMFKATSVLTAEKLVPPLAYKLIDTCRGAVENNDTPRHDLLSTLSVALAAVGKDEEARETAGLLAGLDLPEDDLDLIKTVAALISLDMGEDARYFLDELCAVQPTEPVLLIAAEAEMNAGDRDAARDRLARCLTVAPDNMTAGYLLDRLNKLKSGRVEYDYALPDREAKKLHSRVVKYAVSDEQDPDPGKTDAAVRYLLSCGNTAAAMHVAEIASDTEHGRRAFSDYLLDIEGSPALKREIIYGKLISGDRDIPLYSFGYRTASPSDRNIELAGGGSMLRAYFRAYATYIVYCRMPCRLERIFPEVVAVLAGYSGNVRFDRDGAAALIALCNPDLQRVGLERSALYAGSDEKAVSEMVAAVKNSVRLDIGEEE